MTQIENSPIFDGKVFYSVRKKDELENPIENLRDFISATFDSEVSENVQKRGIIVCRERIQADFIAEKLKKLGLPTFAFHKKANRYKKEFLTQKWDDGGATIIVTTTGYMPKLKKKPVQFVVHWTVPVSYRVLIEESRFCLEKKTTSLVYFSKNETGVNIKLLEDKCLKSHNGKAHEALHAFQLMMMYCQDGLCRHGLISKNLGLKYVECKNHCDVCKTKTGRFWMKNVEQKEQLNIVVPEVNEVEIIENPVVNTETVKELSSLEKFDEILKKHNERIKNNRLVGKRNIARVRHISFENPQSRIETLKQSASETSIGRQKSEIVPEKVRAPVKICDINANRETVIVENASKKESRKRACEVLKGENTKKVRTEDVPEDHQKMEKIADSVTNYFKKLGDKIKETDLTKERVKTIKIKIKWRLYVDNVDESTYEKLTEFYVNKYILKKTNSVNCDLL